MPSIMKPEVNKLNNTEVSDLPIRQAIIIIEHKIRNLEKRKNKLESYRTIQFSGKELSNDQKTAVAKYDEVAQSLELARDFFKQLCQLSNNYEKEVKKQVRKEAVHRAQQETTKVREVLILQDTLNLFQNEEVWNDFVNGVNGAILLNKTEVDVLRRFYVDVTSYQNAPNKNIDADVQKENFQKAAEYLSLTVDSKSKIYYDDFTFENIKDLLDKVRSSGYKKSISECISENKNVESSIELPKTTTANQNQINNEDQCFNEQAINVGTEFKSEAPSATILPPPIFSNPDVLLNEKTEQNNICPKLLETTPEQVLFKNQPIHIRPISEVIGVGNFFFIQDSEIDVPELEINNVTGTLKVQENEMQTIQSQTFTNQSMVSDGSQAPFQQKLENSLNLVENYEKSSQSAFMKVDSPNASNLPMPGFPALGSKNVDNMDNDWKSQVNDYEAGKWSSNDDHKSSSNRPRTNISDRNGNTRPHLKQNGFRGNSNYFKNNDVYFNQGAANNTFRARNLRDRGNSYSSRTQK